jgi:hypothetical protein
MFGRLEEPSFGGFGGQRGVLSGRARNLQPLGLAMVEYYRTFWGLREIRCA